MRNRDYWQMRFRQLEDARHKTDLSTILKLETQYQQAQQEIEGQISTWYQRFADNNGITMAEARQWMQGKDLQEFKWTVQQYIDYGRENALNGQWMKELENASAKFHISKLEALQIQTQQSLEKLFGNQADMIDRAMGRAYTGAYYRTAYELQRGFNVGFNVSGIDQKQLDKVLVKPWAADGFNFSERIWNNKNKLISELHGELSRNILTGQDPQKAINSLAKKMGASKSNTARLIQTEQAYFSSAAQAECFSDLGVEEYEIVATLDSRTSDICRNLDGQHFPMKDYEAGVTAPPFHVNCRSTTVPYFPDNFGQIGERAARDADGKTYYVPDDLKYSDWKAAFVDGNAEGFEEIQENHFKHVEKPDTIKVGKSAEALTIEDFPTAFRAKGEIKNTQALIDYINGLEDADPNAVALYKSIGKLENFEDNGIAFKISHGKDYMVQSTNYRMSGDLAEVKLVIPKLEGEDLAGQVNTTLHEEMHLMDLYGRQDSGGRVWFSVSRPSLMDAFGNTSRSMSDEVKNLFADFTTEYRKIHNEVSQKYNTLIVDLNNSMVNGTFKGPYSAYKKEYNRLVAAQKAEFSYRSRNIMGGGVDNLQDIYDALSGGLYRDKGTVTFGHGSAYYRSRYNRVEETIANYASLSVTRPDLIAIFKRDKPELAAELDATILELLKKARGET